VLNLNATAMRTLWDGGADPKSVIDAVTSGDLSRLIHTGNLSVQLQDPNAKPEPAPAAEPTPDVTDSEGKSAVNGARAALRAQGIIRPTQAQVAEFLGVSDRTVRRWEQG
jgi:hypothetical protein